jgi:hypothetical protein
LELTSEESKYFIRPRQSQPFSSEFADRPRPRVGVRDVHLAEREAVEEATAVVRDVVEDGPLAIAETSAIYRKQRN